MPWDQTENYIRSGHRNPEDFDPETLKTVTINEEGIKAVTAKPWNSQSTEVVSYLFNRQKGWTTEKIEDWLSSHPQYVQAAEPPQPEPASPKPLGEAIIASSETRPIRLLGNSSLVTTVSVESDRIGIYGLSSFTYQNYALNDDTWYCFEVKFVKDASNGEFVLYIDGSPVISITGVDTSSKNAVDTIRLGLTDYGTYTTTVYIDCVVVADAYIGPETAEQTYTRTWAADALFKKLGITRTLGVDAAIQKQDISETFGLDVAFQKSLQAQGQIDVLFQKLDATETFGLDSCFGVSEAQAYTNFWSRCSVCV